MDGSALFDSSPALADSARACERFLVGALLLDPAAISQAQDEGLRPEHLDDGDLRLVYRALAACDAAGQGCDAPQLLDALGALGVEHRRATALLADLGSEIPTSTWVRQHVRIVRRWSRARGMAAALRLALARIPEGSEAAEAWVGASAAQVLASATEARDGTRTSLAGAVDAVVAARLAEADGQSTAPTGLPLPWPSLQRRTGGLGPGQLVLLAARPKVGKSACALQIALHAAQHGAVLFCSLEMTREEIATRAVSILASVSGDVVAGRRAPETEDLQALCRAAEMAASLPLEIADAGMQTLTSIRAGARQIAAKGPLALVVVDYLQLVTSEGLARDATREREVAVIARGLKALAMELGVPVVALSQLSRAADGGGRPRLSHLRESGALEQDANAVWFLHPREGSEPDAVTQTIELIVAAQRAGDTGTVTLTYRRAWTTFFEAATEPAPYSVGGWEGSSV